MTTNFAEHKHTSKTIPNIFDMWIGRDRSIIGEDKTIDETINLLKRAQKTIEKAERVITNQTKRIQSLEELNTADELTGLLNHRGFEHAFQRERSRLSRNTEQNGMVILIEIENFDHVKSKHGQKTSDSCLKLVASILRDEIRNMDSLARIKKDGFALLFSGANTDVALDRTQRLALKINNLSLIKGIREIPINASISLQDFRPNTEFQTLFKGEKRHE